jgi:hypothetical protein
MVNAAAEILKRREEFDDKPAALTSCALYYRWVLARRVHSASPRSRPILICGFLRGTEVYSSACWACEFNEGLVMGTIGFASVANKIKILTRNRPHF